MADLALEMSSNLAMVSLSQTGSKCAYHLSELMSIPRKVVVIEGCATFLELRAKPSSLHVATMVSMLLTYTEELGGPTVK